MPKRISKDKTKETEETTDSALLSRIMAQMGRKGGRIGGKRRLETMTPEERSQSAHRAAQARWKKKPKISS